MIYYQNTLLYVVIKTNIKLNKSNPSFSLEHVRFSVMKKESRILKQNTWYIHTSTIHKENTIRKSTPDMFLSTTAHSTKVPPDAREACRDLIFYLREREGEVMKKKPSPKGFKVRLCNFSFLLPPLLFSLVKMRVVGGFLTVMKVCLFLVIEQMDFCRLSFTLEIGCTNVGNPSDLGLTCLTCIKFVHPNMKGMVQICQVRWLEC